MSLGLEGAAIEWYEADYCVGYGRVRDQLFEVDDPAEPPRWFGIHLLGTDVVLACPRTSTVLTASFDHDGAVISLVARPWRSRIADLRLEDAYRTRWQRWLDPLEPLDEATVAAEIARLEAELSSRVAAEDDA